MTENIALGIDPGSLRIGLAVSDAHGILASPLCTLPRQPLSTLCARLRAELTRAGLQPLDAAGDPASLLERRITALVCGLPLELRGVEGAAAAAARELARAVGDCLGLSAQFVDERLSTKELLARRSDSGSRGKAPREGLDAHAAAAILQAWLEQQRGLPPG